MRLFFNYSLMLLFATFNAVVIASNSNANIYQTCVSCHEPKTLDKQVIVTPTISGLEDWYIERQLLNFKNGVRGTDSRDVGGQQMKSIASALSDQQISALSVYISNLPVVDFPAMGNADIESGKKTYLSNCAACHGNNAQGNQALNAPGLTSLNSQYLIQQLEFFSQDIRGAHASDKYGKQMAMMAKTLPNAAARENVIAYISTL